MLPGPRVEGSARPGVIFVDSPTPESGCDAAGGAASEARLDLAVDGTSLYLFLTAVIDGSEQEYGADAFGVDRSDPTLDSRGGAFACP